MGLSLRGFLAAGIISLSSAGAFGADSKSPFPPCTTVATEADRKAAQGAFAAGQGSFNEADYSTAITYWRDAYRRDCTAHALLLNLARAYELKGDRGEAVSALEAYLQRKPDAPDADQIRRRIENLKAQLPAAAPPSVASAAPPAIAQPAAPPPPPPSVGPAAPPPAPESGEPSRSRSAAPLIVAGGGGVVAVVGAVVLAGGIKKVSDATDQCPLRVSCPDSVAEEGNSGRRQQVMGGLLLGLGLAAAGGGLLWYFISNPASDAPARSGAGLQRASASPAVGPGFAGISIAGSF